MDTLKKFTFYSTTSSMKKRNDLFQELFDLLENKTKTGMMFF